MTTNNSLLDGYVTSAIAAKSALTAAQAAAAPADQAWTSALLSLGLMPGRPNRFSGKGGSSTSSTSSSVNTADLQALANAKIAADANVAAAQATYNAAQTALTQTLKALGAQ